MSRVPPEATPAGAVGRAHVDGVQRWITVAAALTLVTLFRYLILSLWHVWSLANGRGGLSPLGPDDGDGYLLTAREIAAGWTGTVIVNIYPVLVGRVMRATGIESVFFYKHINFLGGLAVIAVGLLLYRRLRRWGEGPVPADADSTSITLLILLFGLYASAISYEEFTLTRDGWIYLTHMVAVLVSIGIAQHRGFVRLALIALLPPMMALLFSLRFYAPAGYLVGAMGWWVWPRMRRRFGMLGAVALMNVLALMALFVVVEGSRTFAAKYALASGLPLTTYRSTDPTAAGSNLGIDFLHAPLALQYPMFLYSAASNMLGPFPWQIRSASTAAGFLVEVPMLSFVLWRIWRLRDYITRASSFLVWQAVAWFLVIGYFNDNLGTAFRLRVLGWHVLFVLYPVLRQRRIDADLHNLANARLSAP